MKKSILRKSLVVGIIGLFIGTGVGATIFESPSCSPQQLTRGWLYVGGSGPGNYTKIQDAIDNASDGDTVFVFQGTYYENVIVNKSIHLLGENRNNTIIHSAIFNDTVYIVSSGVNLSNFTILSDSHDVIRIKSGNVRISNNTLIGLGKYSGVIFCMSSSFNTINDNSIYSPNLGIMLAANSNNIIMNNKIVAINCSEGARGISMGNSSDNVILRNMILDFEIGMYLTEDNNNIIKGNILKNNTWGISLYRSKQNKIMYNHIETSGHVGIYVDRVSFTFIMNNNFIGSEKRFLYVYRGFIFAPLNYWGPNVFFPGITKTDGGIAFCFPWRVKPVDINV